MPSSSSQKVRPYLGPSAIALTNLSLTVTGKNIAFVHVGDQQLIDSLKDFGMPDTLVAELSEMVFTQREFGCAFASLAREASKH